jgi:hypothetical protein
VIGEQAFFLDSPVHLDQVHQQLLLNRLRMHYVAIPVHEVLVLGQSGLDVLQLLFQVRVRESQREVVVGLQQILVFNRSVRPGRPRSPLLMPT